MSILETCPEHGEPLVEAARKLRCPAMNQSQDHYAHGPVSGKRKEPQRCEVTAPLPESLRLQKLGSDVAPRLL